eukprot:g4372.t1
MDELTEQLQQAELAGDVQLLRKIKHDLDKMFIEHDLQNKQLKKSNNKLHKMVKFSKQIEEITDYLSKTLKQRVEKAKETREEFIEKKRVLVENYVLSQKKIEQSKIELAVAKNKYKRLSDYMNSLNEVNIDQFEQKLDSLQKDVSAIFEFRNALALNLMFIDDDGKKETKNEFIQEEEEQLLHLFRLIDDSNTSIDRHNDENIVEKCQTYLDNITSKDNNDDEYVKYLDELKKEDLKTLMTLCIKTKLIYIKEQERESNLIKMIDLDGIGDIDIFKRRMEDEIQGFQTKTAAMERECEQMKIRWDTRKTM